MNAQRIVKERAEGIEECRSNLVPKLRLGTPDLTLPCLLHVAEAELHNALFPTGRWEQGDEESCSQFSFLISVWERRARRCFSYFAEAKQRFIALRSQRDVGNEVTRSPARQSRSQTLFGNARLLKLRFKCAVHLSNQCILQAILPSPRSSLHLSTANVLLRQYIPVVPGCCEYIRFFEPTFVR